MRPAVCPRRRTAKHGNLPTKRLPLKLSLKSNPSECFDAPSSIGKALVACGIVDEVKPKPIPVDREVKWKLVKATLGESYYITAACPVCHHKASIFGHSGGLLPTYKHCGRADEVPTDIENQFFKYLAQIKPRERETPPTNKYTVGLL
jgi:hypothetical protein